MIYLKSLLLLILLLLTSNLYCDAIHAAVYNKDLESTQTILESDPSLIESLDKEGVIIDNSKLSAYYKMLQFDFEKQVSDGYTVATTKGFTPLIIAILNEDLAMMEMLLSYKANINNGNKVSKNMPLHIAAIMGNYSILERLLRKKPLLEVKNNYQFTPLLLGVALGNNDIVNLLLKHKAKVNIANSNGVTPLMYAALSGNISLADSILEVGSKVNVQDHRGNTALMYAAFYGNTGMIAYLVNSGAVIDKGNSQGLNPLTYAAISGQLRTVQFLIEKGANFKKKLMYSVTLGDGKIYPAGSDIMKIAKINGNKEMISYLTPIFS